MQRRPPATPAEIDRLIFTGEKKTSGNWLIYVFFAFAGFCLFVALYI